MYKSFLIQMCFPYKALGYKVLNDNTELFGNDIRIAPQAWLHQIYPPLNNAEIILLEQLIGQTIPKSLIDFYHEMNGFSIFCTKFSISGLRKDFSRSIEASWQPFSIETKNKKEKPLNAKKEYVFIGFYSWDENLVYINSKTEEVSICTIENADPIKTWDNLYGFICEAVTYIFSKYGVNYYPRLGQDNAD